MLGESPGTCQRQKRQKRETRTRWESLLLSSTPPLRFLLLRPLRPSDGEDVGARLPGRGPTPGPSPLPVPRRRPGTLPPGPDRDNALGGTVGTSGPLPGRPGLSARTESDTRSGTPPRSSVTSNPLRGVAPVQLPWNWVREDYALNLLRAP